MLIALAIAAGIGAAVIVLALIYSPKPIERQYETTLPVYTETQLTRAQAARLNRIQTITRDADAIMQRVYRGLPASRDCMERLGMSARRWTTARGTLIQLGILSDGGTVAGLDLQEARTRLKLWYRARKTRIVGSPAFVPGYGVPDQQVVTAGSGSSGSRSGTRSDSTRRIRAHGT